MDFRAVTVEELGEGVRSGTLTAVGLAEAALRRIDSLDQDINAFVALDAGRSLAEAARVDEMVAAGEAVGPLAGVPVAVKDVTDVAGWVTTHGSVAHADDPPAPDDAVIVARLRAAGAVVIGKTNSPEHGWTSDTTNELFGPTRNPWDLTRSPGGSSGGSAAALAAGMVPLATGSDGGGSIRIPSAVCGLSGFKPTLGRVPNAGPVAAGWGMLSTSGPMARRIRDVAYALDAVVGPHRHDPWSWPVVDGPWAPTLEDPGLPARIAWSPDLGYGPVDDAVRATCVEAVATLSAAGCEVVEVEGPFAEDPLPPWLVLASTFLLRSLLPYRGTEMWERITPGLRDEIEWADNNLDATDFVLAIDAAHEASVALAECLTMAGAEVLLSPTVAGFAPPVGGTGTINGKEDPNWVRFTYPFNLTRSPAGTVCAGLVDGLPVGLQVVGMPGDDLAVLRTLAGLEDLLACDELAPVS